MRGLRTFAAAAAAGLIACGGCVVSQGKYKAEQMKVAELREDLDKASAAIQAGQQALKDKVAEVTSALAKKSEADLAAAKQQAAAELKSQTDALQSTVSDLQSTITKLNQASKQQAAALLAKANDIADRDKTIDILKKQLKAEQDKVLELTVELEAAKKPPPPPAPTH